MRSRRTIAVAALGMLAAGLLWISTASIWMTTASAQGIPEVGIAELQWDFVQIDDYEISYFVSCACAAATGEIAVVVEEGEVASATTADGSVVADPRTVPSMFAEIQVELARPAASVAGSFDIDIGRPLYYRIDPSADTSGDEYSVIVTGFTSNKFVKLQERLDAAKAQWASLAPATEDYNLSYLIDCMCIYVRNGEVEVRGGEVIRSSVRSLEFAVGRTIEDLFAEVQQLIDDQQQGRVIVAFDSETGIPEEINVNYSLFGIDFLNYRVTGFAFVDDCCDPQPVLDVAVSCVNDDGRVDVSFVSTTLADGPVEHALSIGTLAPRLHTVLSGETVTEVATGRPDGPLQIDLRIGDVLQATETVAIVCDPELPEVAVAVSCFADNGRFDIWVTAPPLPPQLPGEPPQAAVLFSYVVELSAAGRPSIERAVDVAQGTTVRSTITGRDDRQYTVRVFDGDEAVYSQRFTVDCDVATDPVELAVSCLGTDGRFDIELLNDGDAAATYVVSVSPLADRSVSLEAGERSRVIYTGRPDRETEISVTRDGVIIFADTVTPACDSPAK